MSSRVRKYTEKEKLEYYKKLARAKGRAKVSGRGAYRIGRSYVRGRGAYNIPKNLLSATNIGSVLGGAGGAAIGTMLAPGIGTKMGYGLGSELGRGAGKLFKDLTGWGDYTVKANSLLFPDHVVPSFGDDSIRVRKREFIADVNASTAFSNNVFPVNPGLSEVFPWLSSIANNFEQYRFNGLIFQFVSTSSDAIASTTDLGLGQVILASDYNAVDPAFVNAPQMLSSMFSNSGKPSENIMHAIECAPTDQAQKLYYVRSGDVPAHSDLRLYDLCTFQLATQNMPAVYSGMGQLWVSYDVTFCKSVQNNQLGFDINTDKYQISGAVGGTPLGTSQTLVAGSNLGTTISQPVGGGPGILYFPAPLASGYYLIVFAVVGPNASTMMVEFSTNQTNCTLQQVWQGDSATNWSDTGMSAGAATLKNIWFAIVRIDDRDASIQINADGTFPGSSTSADLLITQVNGELFV